MSELKMPERIKFLAFEAREIGGMIVKNRLVRSATYEHMASEGGRVTHKLVKLYRTLAEGGVGLIITGAAYVQLSGKSVPWHDGDIQRRSNSRIEKNRRNSP